MASNGQLYSMLYDNVMKLLTTGKIVPDQLGSEIQKMHKVSLQRHNHKSQQKPSQPTLKRRCFFVKSDVFLWPGFRKEWC